MYDYLRLTMKFSASNSRHMISRLSHLKSRYDVEREKYFPLGVSIQQIYCPLSEG